MQGTFKVKDLSIDERGKVRETKAKEQSIDENTTSAFTRRLLRIRTANSFELLMIKYGIVKVHYKTVWERKSQI